MKYIITFSAVLFLSLSSMAQTGLVFSQCLTFGGQANPYSLTYTVPDGKVWKIEYAQVDYTTSPSRLYINNTTACFLSTSIDHFPIWAKAGDEIKILSSGNGVDYFLSILEFNSN